MPRRPEAASIASALVNMVSTIPAPCASSAGDAATLAARVLVGAGDSPIPLTGTSMMVNAGERVVVVDRTMPAMPTSWTSGGQTITPTYVPVDGLGNVRISTLADSYCGLHALRVQCGGQIVRNTSGGDRPARNWLMRWPQLAFTSMS